MERNGIISRNFEGIKYGTEWQSRGVFVRHAIYQVYWFVYQLRHAHISKNEYNYSVGFAFAQQASLKTFKAVAKYTFLPKQECRGEHIHTALTPCQLIQIKLISTSVT